MDQAYKVVEAIRLADKYNLTITKNSKGGIEVRGKAIVPGDNPNESRMHSNYKYLVTDNLTEFVHFMNGFDAARGASLIN